jgi:hypothetical protein
MALSRGDRFRLKRQRSDALDSRARADVELLFGEFGLDDSVDDYGNVTVVGALQSVSDDQLLGLAAMVQGRSDVEVLAELVSESPDVGLWKPKYLRVFASHSAKRKAFIGEIKELLDVAGVDLFVAHDSMTVSKPWQAQIEVHLSSMDALVAFVHPEVNESPWCQQEVGWALGRGVPRFAIRLGC